MTAPVEDEVEDLADALDGPFSGESNEEHVYEPLCLTGAQGKNLVWFFLPGCP